MSLMRLLAVGRSLKSIEDRPSRYKMAQQNLPRFGQKTAAPRIEQGAGFLRGVGLQAWRAVRAWVFEPWEPVVQAVAAKCSPQKWKNPFRRTARRPTQVVQTEFLLESIRVVRNDLTDSDLEMIARRPAPKAGRGGKVWGRLTSRIFGPDENAE